MTITTEQLGFNKANLRTANLAPMVAVSGSNTAHYFTLGWGEKELRYAWYIEDLEEGIDFFKVLIAELRRRQETSR